MSCRSALFVGRRAVTADAGSEAARAGFGLAARHGCDAETKLVQHRRVPAEPPLLDRRQPVGAQGCLRQPRQLMRQLCRGGERLAWRDDAINETDTLRL